MNFYFLTSDFMKVYRQWVPCKPNSLHSFSPLFMQLCTSFFHGLKMCMWFGFNPAVNFCHLSKVSTLLTLSFFNFSQVRHQLRRRSVFFCFYLGLRPVKIIAVILSRVSCKVGQKREISEKKTSDYPQAELGSRKQNLACLACVPS